MSTAELLVFFAVIPAVACALAVAWSRLAMRAAAERTSDSFGGREAIGKFLVFTFLFATPLIFGLIVFILVLDVPEAPTNNAALRSLGTMFALAALSTALSAAWILARRSAVAYGENFGRVLSLAVLPQTVIVYVLVVAILIVGRLPGPTDPPLSGADAETLSITALYMVAGAAGGPLGAVGANRPVSLVGRGFSRATRWGLLGTTLVIVAFIFAFLRLSTG